MIGKFRAGVVLAIIIAVTLVGIPVQMLAMRTGRPDPRTIPRLWHRLAVRLLGIRVHVIGAPAIGRPLLLAANHVSWTDIPVLSSLLPVSFVAKSDMASWPVFGLLARLQRSVFVERNRARTSPIQAGELGRRLADGEAMVLFAEGTTSDGNTVAPFKSTLFGAARAALEAADGVHDTVLVQPVTIAYTRLHGIPMGRQHRRHVSWVGDSDLVPHLAALIREGGIDVEVHFGEALAYTKASDRKQIARLMEAEVRATMAQALRNPRSSRKAG
jgi:1-acyl-sn-glycerol-3-phosphate acyltransferase